MIVPQRLSSAMGTSCSPPKAPCSQPLAFAHTGPSSQITLIIYFFLHHQFLWKSFSCFISLSTQSGVGAPSTLGLFVTNLLHYLIIACLLISSPTGFWKLSFISFSNFTTVSTVGSPLMFNKCLLNARINTVFST